MPTNNDGLPDGTVIVPVPATCPELADVYNAPLCAFDHELIYIPMRELANTGGGDWVPWVLIAWVLIALGATAIISVFLQGAKRRNRE